MSADMQLAMSNARQAGLEANQRYFGDNVPKGGAIAFLEGIDAFLSQLASDGLVIVPRVASEEMIAEGAASTISDLTRVWKKGEIADADYFRFTDSIPVWWSRLTKNGYRCGRARHD